MRAFGQHAKIELVAFGGLTIPDGPRLPKFKEFLVVFAGPFFGFCLFLVSFFLWRSQLFGNPLLNAILQTTAVVNLFWTILNLLPVLPLDGGQLMRIILEAIFGPKGMRIALIASIVVSATVAVAFLIYGAFLVGALFFIFAFQNFETYRRMRIVSPTDGNEEYQQELASIEEMLVEGRLDEALPTLESLRTKTKKGILYNLCTQYIAQIYYKKRDLKRVYELLKPIYKDIAPLELVMLQEAASLEQDYELVSNISGECFQVVPSPEIALRAAKASASKQDTRSTIGWLSAAANGGVQNIEEFIQDSAFDTVRDSKEFAQLIEKLRHSR